jgi:hypothetical protein
MSLAVSGDYYGSGSGVDGYKGKFIPEIWSSKLQVKYYKATCMSEIFNSDWAGEIKDQGDKVIIRTIPTITINDYQKGQTLTSQVPAAGTIELLIDKGKYFQFVLDDVDDVQSDLRLMDMFGNDAAQQMKIGIESLIFDGLVAKLLAATSAASANADGTAGALSGNLNLGTSGTPVSISKANILDSIVDVGQAMDEQNLPETGRWFVIPPWAAALIKKSDLKDASLSGDGTSILRNGRLGTIDRFTLYCSNNLKYTVGDLATHMLAGTRDAVCFASQFTKMETLRSTTTFGNIVRGLQVFGYELTKPEALFRLYAAKGA